MSENLNNEVAEKIANESVKELADALKKVSASSSSEEIGLGGAELSSSSEPCGSTFKVAGTNLPEKPSVWTKMKNILFYEINVELTPKQQKIEDEINEFLHKEITWNSVKNFLLQEVPITYKGKRVF